MNNGTGLISKIYAWTWHPSNSSETIYDWIAFFIVVLILSYMWSTVINVVD
jgi:hypothetical protein